MTYLQKFQLGLNYLNIMPPFSKTDFPVLRNGKIIWFDNGATSQKPSCVINCISEYYNKYNSNIHRSPHQLSMISSKMFDDARSKTADFLGCSAQEIIFVKGATEGINLLANSLYSPETSVLCTNMEHHSNIVPWQLVYHNLLYLMFDIKKNILDIDKLDEILSANPSIKIITVAHVSNVLGIVNPIKKIASIVHKHGRILIVDGAQGIPHYKVNVRELDCDAYVFSSHKLFGPTGVGVVYVKESLYEIMKPWQGGGSMIKNVELHTSEFQDPPYKFEAGTPNIADVIAFGKCLDYLTLFDWNIIEEYEKQLTQHMFMALNRIKSIVILGNTLENKVPVFSFHIPNINDNELLTHLDNHGIAVRYGHHCAQPIIKHFGYENVYRVSLAPYNTKEEINKFISVISGYLNKNQ